MAGNQRIGGLLTLRLNGVGYLAKGKFSYGLGVPKREPIMGVDRPHGFKELPVIGFIEGEITDDGSLDLVSLFTAQGATVTLQLNNGKTVMADSAWYAGDGKTETDEGNVPFLFHSNHVEEFQS